jgi:hypothetical protein
MFLLWQIFTPQQQEKGVVWLINTFFGGENGPNSSYFKENLSKFDIFELQIPLSCQTKVEILKISYSLL